MGPGQNSGPEGPKGRRLPEPDLDREKSLTNPPRSSYQNRPKRAAPGSPEWYPLPEMPLITGIAAATRGVSGAQRSSLVTRVRIPYGVQSGRPDRGPALWFLGEGRFQLRGLVFGV